MSTIDYLNLTEYNLCTKNRYYNYNNYILLDIIDKVSSSNTMLDFIDSYLTITNDCIHRTLCNNVLSYYNHINLFINNILRSRRMYNLHDDTCCLNASRYVHVNYLNICISQLYINNEKIFKKFKKYNKPCSLFNITKQYIYNYNTINNINLVEDHSIFNKFIHYNNCIYMIHLDIFNSIEYTIQNLNRDDYCVSIHEFHYISDALFELLKCIKNDKEIILTDKFLNLLTWPVALFFNVNILSCTYLQSKYCNYCISFRDYLEENFIKFFLKKYKLLYPLNERLTNACINTECIF